MQVVSYAIIDSECERDCWKLGIEKHEQRTVNILQIMIYVIIDTEL